MFGQNICCHVAAFAIPFNLIGNMTIFRKKLNSDHLTHSPRVGVAVYSGKYKLQSCCINDSI